MLICICITKCYYPDSEIIDLYLFPLSKFYTMIYITFIIKKFVSMCMLNYNMSDLVSIITCEIEKSSGVRKSSHIFTIKYLITFGKTI